ncbi:MAG: calcium-binding protein, partial [Variibacter sp.]
GADKMYGFGGDDIYIVDKAGDQVFESAGNGTDQVYSSVNYTLAAGQSIEVLNTMGSSSTANINLTGNEINNTLVGNAGINRLNGGGGADKMYGFGGNDIYIVDNAGDQVFESAGNGTDQVYSSVNYTLAAGQSIEVLNTMGSSSTANINLTGNEIANALVGNAGANTLNGGAGNDALYGFGGADNFLFNTALNASTNVDRIMDYNVAADTIQLAKSVFAAFAATGTINANAFFIGSAAHDADDRIIYNATTGALLYDDDGTGAHAAVQFATLTTHPAITNADFVVV